MELPNEIVRAENRNPRTMLIYSKPKQGKTTIVSGLENYLIVDTETGSKFIDAYKVEVENFDGLRAVAKAIYTKGFTILDQEKQTGKYTPPYKFLIVDTLTRIDEWSEIEGTFRYMRKPQGKSFNRVGGLKDGEWLPVNHPEFETVHEIGQGYGYKHSREAVLSFFDSFNTLAPHIIYNCHVKDKFLGVSNSGGDIVTKEINLTGRLKDIISTKVDTVAYGFRDGGKFILSFADDTGSRSTHVSGRKVVVAESFDIEEKEYNEAFKKAGQSFERFRIGNTQFEKIKLPNNTYMYQRLEFYWDKIYLK